MTPTLRPLIVADVATGYADPYVPLTCDLLVFHPDFETGKIGWSVGAYELHGYLQRRHNAIESGQVAWDPCDTAMAQARLQEARDSIATHYQYVPAA